MNTNVNFEIAKLLKEKGYNELCSKIYINEELKDAWKKVNYDDILTSAFYIAPTIADVVMWLYEKYGIWLTVTSISQLSWQCHITKKGDSLGKCYLEDFPDPTSAYSAGILETLKNLI